MKLWLRSVVSPGPEDWTLATAPEVSPDEVHFRWSPKHQDLEVISTNSRPVYLQAPGTTKSCSLPYFSSPFQCFLFSESSSPPPAVSYLGNQLLSYGQNLSFSLRLDRGVRHPSSDDVILEGGSQRVSTSLGDLDSIIPSGKKIQYSFRLA